MEMSAIKEMFSNSMQKYCIKYRNYIGDRDSKTFNGVKD
ncbi:hypothetical protein EAI_02569, partial [Harpegnathos saltator]